MIVRYAKGKNGLDFDIPIDANKLKGNDAQLLVYNIDVSHITSSKGIKHVLKLHSKSVVVLSAVSVVEDGEYRDALSNIFIEGNVICYNVKNEGQYVGHHLILTVVADNN